MAPGKAKSDALPAQNTQSEAGPDAEDESAAAPATDKVEPTPVVDWFSLATAAKNRPRSIRDMPRLVFSAVSFVYRAGPGIFRLAIGMQLFGAVLVVSQVLLGKAALDAVVGASGQGSAVRRAVPIVFALAVAGAVSSIVGIVSSLRQRLLGELATRQVWRDILEVSASLELADFETAEFYDHLQRVRVSAVARPFIIAQGIVGLVGGAIGTVGITVTLLAIEPLLVPTLFLSGVPMWYASKRVSRNEFAFVVAQSPAMRLRQYLTQVLTGRDEAKEIRVFDTAPVLTKQYDDSYGEYIDETRKVIRKRERLMIAGTIASTILTTGTLALLLWLVDRNRITLAEAGAALLGIRLLASQVNAMFGGFGQVFESSLFLEDLHAFLAHRRPLDSSTRAGSAPPIEHISVSNVSFRYPGVAVDALRDVSMDIPGGSIIALVGENGSGKTTLAKLLAGLYQPTAGSIHFNNENVADLHPATVRLWSAAIFQDFVRYRLTAKHNIGLGRPSSMGDLDAVRLAAAQAGADSFLDRLPKGYETILSKEYESGVDLSIGQWQRVALARAFFRNSPFVILDEPSASLDARAEHELFESIRSLLAGRTVLLISHRYSTVRSADHIFVLRKGKIVEHGKHDALMAENGLYSELFTLQASAYLDEAQPTV